MPFIWVPGLSDIVKKGAYYKYHLCSLYFHLSLSLAFFFLLFNLFIHFFVQAMLNLKKLKSR